MQQAAYHFASVLVFRTYGVKTMGHNAASSVSLCKDLKLKHGTSKTRSQCSKQRITLQVALKDLSEEIKGHNAASSVSLCKKLKRTRKKDVKGHNAASSVSLCKSQGLKSALGATFRGQIG